MMGVISHQLGAGDSLPNTRSFQTVTLGLAFPASAIQKFPMSKLKIDSSFVRDVSVNADDAMIATAIISMAKSIKLKGSPKASKTTLKCHFFGHSEINSAVTLYLQAKERDRALQNGLQYRHSQRIRV